MADDYGVQKLNADLLEAFKPKEKNVVAFSTFKKFLPLFVKENQKSWGDLPKELRSLANEYRLLVDPYVRTEIIDDHTGAVIIELPQLFIAMPTLDMENPSVVAQVLQNSKLAGDPVHSARSLNMYLSAFLENATTEKNMAAILEAIKTTEKIAGVSGSTPTSSDWDYI